MRLVVFAIIALVAIAACADIAPRPPSHGGTHSIAFIVAGIVTASLITMVRKWRKTAREDRAKVDDVVKSNFYPTPFTLNGETWSCVEQFYQCAKFGRGSEPYNRIRTQERPGGMKGLASHYAAEVRDDWDTVKIGIMERALRAKFTQNPHLLDIYAKVSRFTLIHESPKDTFWGMSRERKGGNRLGVLVKAVCDELLVNRDRQDKNK